jgi:hypothetical protein
MNKKHFFFWLAIAAMCVTLFSTFNKDKEDYRDKWVGDWDLHIRSESWNHSIGVFSDTTYYYSGKITFGDASNQLNIRYRENSSIDLSVDENGKFLEFFSDYLHSCDGKFKEDGKLYLYLSWGGMGGGLNETIHGIKK